ncbi:ABC transporter substrate-binding protein [Hahella sp. CCB-MM4]|uniref:ABC transporter substrate-binding protein n=1 Tax=Hahella sp. (strain CCB-MM4) TaxID=1926491 RepID=UPI000B9BCE74|nr:ABC transporter substrate binding protein [Hahella sp. CCB-MM4]OZG70716.1 ABC transporter substrate-binding protein [Hahella sp. CCB-MM4]
MRIKPNLPALVAVILMTLWTSLSVSAEDPSSQRFSTDPVTNDGKRWRIGYYEGGEYINYQQVLTATVRSLMSLGWIESKIIPPQEGEQTADLWKWFSESLDSDYIEFVKDAHYSAHWDDKLSEKMKNTIIDRLNSKQDIDLMIAMGTRAGLDLANDRHHTPTLVLSSTDPVSAGIIKSIEDSGFSHVNATIDPGKYARQIRVFHDITDFKRLGVAYEDTQAGRSYAAIDTIQELGKKLGFSIVPCHTQSDISNISLAEHSAINCYQQLAPKVDAIYVTEQGGVTNKSLPVIVRTAHKYKIPTFSQSGSQEVRYGILASLSQANFRYFGEFHAQTMAKIFNGAKPNELPQLFEEPPRMALNLKTAEIIEFNPSLLLLGATDELFKEIDTPK